MVTPPRAHLFVCANTRAEGSPLGEGCGARGEALYAELKSEVARRGLVTAAWITKTHCLGVCPRAGATVAEDPAGRLPEASAGDAGALLDAAMARDAGPTGPTWDEIDGTLAAMEDLQAKKVIDLARRLSPGLTAEDIKNPHDFPELDDPDWHYADGVLTGIQSASAALRAKR
jgi:hypothetical protein